MAYPPAAPPQAPGIQPAPWTWTPPELTMTADQVKEWRSRIELDRTKREKESRGWKELLRSYLPAGSVRASDTKSNIHFRNVHLKIAETWAQFPQLQMGPSAPLPAVPDPQTGQPITADEITAIKIAVLNRELGRTKADVDLTIEEALFDIYATSGVAATKICYEADVKYTTQLAPGPPGPMPGAVLGLQDVPQGMVPTQVPTVVHERFRWYRFSPEKLGIPHDWHSTRYDEAPYLWMDFSERNTAGARQKYGLPENFTGTSSRDERILSDELDPIGANLDLLQGVEIWLHASQFSDDEVHSEVFYRLVLIEGLEERPAIYEFSPYQSKHEDGSLTDDSMIGNPIHPIVLRVASDMAWIPADSAFTNPLVEREDRWAAQDDAIREANIPRFLHAVSITKAIDKLKEADTGQGVSIPDEIAMLGMERLILPLPHLERAQSDIAGRQANQRAITETLGIGANQAGSQTDTVRSATETATVQVNVSKRLSKEQTKLVNRVLQGVEQKFDPLLKRFKTDKDFVEITGVDGARKLAAYTNAHLAGRYSYEILTDSQLSQDQSSRIKRMTDYINFFAKSPNLNQEGALRLGTREFGYNPTELVQQPPKPGPPPIALSINLAAPNLAENLILPEVRAMLIAHGEQLTPTPSAEAVALSAKHAAEKPPHGGGADKADLIDKHHSEKTGLQVGNPPAAGPQAPQVVPGNMVQ